MWRDPKNWFPGTVRFMYFLSGGVECIKGRVCDQNRVKASEKIRIFVYDTSAVETDIAYN